MHHASLMLGDRSEDSPDQQAKPGALEELKKLSYQNRATGDQPQTPALKSRSHQLGTLADDGNKSALLRPAKKKHLKMKKKKRMRKQSARGALNERDNQEEQEEEEE